MRGYVLSILTLVVILVPAVAIGMSLDHGQSGGLNLTFGGAVVVWCVGLVIFIDYIAPRLVQVVQKGQRHWAS